jgi:hypothetical protein
MSVSTQRVQVDHQANSSSTDFAVFQYFVSIIPTTYIDRWGRKLHTNQYSVSDYASTVKHNQGVPGIFIKYDIEPLTMTIHTRTTSLSRFLVRLAGILGGVWVCANYGYRAGSRMVDVVGKMRGSEEPTYDQYASSFSSSLRDQRGPSLTSRGTTSARWMESSVGGIKSAFGGGLGHRPTASVVEKIYSGECFILHDEERN